MSDENSDLVARIALVVRGADLAFQTSGGNTRDWVRDCFLPRLEEEGLFIGVQPDSESEPPPNVLPHHNTSGK